MVGTDAWSLCLCTYYPLHLIACLPNCRCAKSEGVLATSSTQVCWCHAAGVLDEKASASQVLGLYAEATGALYAPHIEDTLLMLQKMANYFHSQVREQAYVSLPLLFVAASQAFPSQAAGLSDFFFSVWKCHSGMPPLACGD